MAPIDPTMSPPPPVQVQGQMIAPQAGPAPQQDGMPPMAPAMGQQQQPANAAGVGRLAEVDGLLDQLVTMVPTLAPDADMLMGRLQEKGGFSPPPGSMMGQQPPQPGIGTASMGQQNGSNGPMGTAVRLEVTLNQISNENPDIEADIRYFLARMRTEVSKTLKGQRPAEKNFAEPPREEPGFKLPIGG